MKKTLLIFIALIGLISFGVAQEQKALMIETLSEPGSTEAGLPYLMTIHYLEATNEAQFIFSINSSLYDQKVAMETIRNRAEQFMKEKLVEGGQEGQRTDQKYYSYSYRGADSPSFDAVNDITHYTTRLLFSGVRKL